MTAAGPRGWLIVAALFLMLGIVIAARNSLGLMMPFLKEDLGWSYKFLSTAGSAMMVTMAAAAPVAGMIVDRHGSRMVYAAGMAVVGLVFLLCSLMTAPWQLVALFGVCGGAAFAALSPSLVSTTIAHRFRERLGLATSIATSGSTAGQIVLMPLLALLVTALAWRGALAVVGLAVLAVAVVVVALIGKEPPRPASRRDGGWRVAETLGALSREPVFWLLGTGFFVCGFTTAGVIKIHLIPYAVACGFPPVESATAYGVLSLFSMIGMIAYGWLADRHHRPLLLASCYFMRALTFVLLLHVAGSTFLLYAFAVLFGIFDYATFPIVASLVATHMGRRIMGVTMGLIFALHSLGGALGTFMGGYLFALFARYDWVWAASVVLALLAALLTLLIREDRGSGAGAALGAAA